MQSFLRWASLQGISLHDDVSVQKSGLGGYGIVSHMPLAEDTILLRTPKSAVLDLSSCMALKTRLQQSNPKVAKTINSFLACSETVSETIILRNYIWAFVSLSHTFDTQFQPYFECLSSTETLVLDPESCSGDEFLELSLSQLETIKNDYERAVESDSHLRQLLPYDQALQLHKAVVSRVLEIPVAETEPDGSNTKESGDFFTNVTLVPMLDFANHSASNSAVFDVDLSSGDIILRLTQEVDANTEITISYDPRPSVNHFFTTYGFVPEETTLFTWHIDGLDALVAEITGKNQNYVRMAKWLHVIPAISMTLTNNNLILDIGRLPSLVIDGLEYYPKWNQEIADLKEEYSEEDVLQIISQLEHHELSSPVVPAGETAFGVLYNDTYVSVPHIMQQTGNSEEVDPRIISKTIQLLRNAAESSLKILDSNRKASESIMQYISAKKRFLQKLSDLTDPELMAFIKQSLELL